MDSATHASARDVTELAALRSVYLRALDSGASAFVVDLEPGCIGLDPRGMLASVELAPVGATAPPELDVTVRCAAGLCVLAGISLVIAGRRVTLENLGVVGCTTGAVRLSASEGAELRGLSVLGNSTGRKEIAAVHVHAPPGSRPSARIEGSTIARNRAGDAALGLYCSSGAWFEEVALDDVTLAGTGMTTIAVDSAQTLTLRGCSLRLDTARVLLRAGGLVQAELSGCRLVAAADGLVELGERSREIPFRLVEGTELSADPVELPAPLTADETVSERPRRELESAVDERIEGAVARIADVDPRLRALAQA
jgi:hypothetical protein